MKEPYGERSNDPHRPQVMQLTEKESAVFRPLYDEYEKILLVVLNRMEEIIKMYTQEYKNLSDRKADKMINDMLEIMAYSLKFKQV